MRVAALHTYPIKGCRRLDHDTVTVQPWGFAGDRRWMITDSDGGFLSQRDEPRLALIRPVPSPGGLYLSAPGVEPIDVPYPDDGGGVGRVQVTVWRSTVAATPAGASVSAWLSGVLNRDVRLVYLDDPSRRTVNPVYAQPGDRVSFADGFPVLLASIDSLARLNDWIAEDFPEDAALLGRLPIERFRPNVVISGGSPFAEDGFVGRRIRIGSVVFRVPKACGRCVVTTVDQDTGERTPQPLRTLARHRQSGKDLLFGTNLIPDGPVPEAQIGTGDGVVVL